MCVCVAASIYKEAEEVCSESVAPYMSSILLALTENISAGIHGMQHTLHTQMDSVFTHTKGGAEETKKARETVCLSSANFNLHFSVLQFCILAKSLYCYHY